MDVARKCNDEITSEKIITFTHCEWTRHLAFTKAKNIYLRKHLIKKYHGNAYDIYSQPFDPTGTFGEMD